MDSLSLLQYSYRFELLAMNVDSSLYMDKEVTFILRLCYYITGTVKIT